jgi:hypothetical protein
MAHVLLMHGRALHRSMRLPMFRQGAWHRPAPASTCTDIASTPLHPDIVDLEAEHALRLADCNSAPENGITTRWPQSPWTRAARFCGPTDRPPAAWHRV